MTEELNKAGLVARAEEAAKVAGQIINTSKVEIFSSIGKDVKINVDKKAHKVILEILKKSDIPILSEEDDKHNFNMDLKWVVDPLDGSINFLRGIPFCAISIGLIKDGVPLLGVVYDFNREEMFSGIVGVGATLNGEEITISNIRKSEEAIIATGFPSYTDFSKGALEKYISLIQKFKKVRLLGSAALSLAYVACGRMDAYYERDIKIWDVVAGLALVAAAGGTYDMKVGENPDSKCLVKADNGNSLMVKHKK